MNIKPRKYAPLTQKEYDKIINEKLFHYAVSLNLNPYFPYLFLAMGMKISAEVADKLWGDGSKIKGQG